MLANLKLLKFLKFYNKKLVEDARKEIIRGSGETSL